MLTYYHVELCQATCFGQQMAFFHKLVAERDRVYSDRVKVHAFLCHNLPVR